MTSHITPVNQMWTLVRLTVRQLQHMRKATQLRVSSSCATTDGLFLSFGFTMGYWGIGGWRWKHYHVRHEPFFLCIYQAWDKIRPWAQYTSFFFFKNLCNFVRLRMTNIFVLHPVYQKEDANDETWIYFFIV